VVPFGIDGEVGVIASDLRRADVTVSVAVPLTCVVGCSAVIVALPAVRADALPSTAIVAIVASLEVQVTMSVTSLVVPSVNVPVATNGCVVPIGAVAIAGVTTRLTIVASVTVRTALAVRPETFSVAITFTVPALSAFALPVASTVAMVLSLVDQSSGRNLGSLVFDTAVPFE
jgi:hypothetical protein